MRNWLKNLNHDQKRYIGIGLIMLGVFMALRLWWALPVLVLGGIGVYVYMERRKQGRISAAVQSGLWLLGLASLLLIHFVFPGILILAGGSLLIRGREHDVDRKVVEFLAKLGINVPAAGQAPIQPVSQVPAAPHVPYTPPTSAGQQHGTPQQEQPSTGETTRL